MCFLLRPLKIPNPLKFLIQKFIGSEQWYMNSMFEFPEKFIENFSQKRDMRDFILT